MKTDRHVYLLVKRSVVSAQIDGLKKELRKIDAELSGNSPQSAGGKARAEKLSPEARTNIARAAANARWSRNDD